MTTLGPLTYFENINEGGDLTATTAMQVTVDDRCLKVVLTYSKNGDSKYCTHYLDINTARELKDVLGLAMMELEEEWFDAE